MVKSYELDNLAFLNAMVARYGPKVGWQIFDDVVPISDPDSPTTIPPGEDLAPVQPIPKGAPLPEGPVGAAERAYRKEPKNEVVSGASRCMVIGPQKSASGYPLMMEATIGWAQSRILLAVSFRHLGLRPWRMGHPDHGARSAARLADDLRPRGYARHVR